MSPLPTREAPSSSKPSSFLKIFFTGLALILFGTFVGVVAARFLPMSGTTNTPVITPTPTITSVPSPTPTTNESINTSSEIIITEPATTSAIKSPVTIKGTAPKSWTFEGVLTVLVEDIQHKTIAGGPVYIKEITGSDNRVSFESTVPFSTKNVSGFITIKNDNPSGLPENNKSFSLPIQFKNSLSVTLKYSCPSNGWVDCMPSTTSKPECSTEAMNWYQINCPDFKGAAL